MGAKNNNKEHHRKDRAYNCTSLEYLLGEREIKERKNEKTKTK